MMLAKVKLNSLTYNSMIKDSKTIKKERFFVLVAAGILMAVVFICQAIWTIEDIPDGGVYFNTLPLEIVDYTCKVIKLATIDVYMTWNFIDLFRYFLAKKKHQLL
jgi:hypothetical protein